MYRTGLRYDSHDLRTRGLEDCEASTMNDNLYCILWLRLGMSYRVVKSLCNFNIAFVCTVSILSSSPTTNVFSAKQMRAYIRK